MAAPVTAIVAYDVYFYQQPPKVFPHRADAVDGFLGDDKKAPNDVTALRNSALQGAYLIIAARALGLDVGPMSGFDHAKADSAFFADGKWKSNFLCNIGTGDSSALFPRNPRLIFEDTCRIE